MVVEGLGADCRLGVVIHQAASSAAYEERISLIREVAHRSRRGARFLFSPVNRPLDRFREDKKLVEVTDVAKKLEQP